MAETSLTQSRAELTRFEYVIGPAIFLLIAAAGTAWYFTALLLWVHRLDDSLLAGLAALAPSLAAFLAIAALGRRQDALRDAARLQAVGSKWTAADGREVTAADVRIHDLAIGESMNGKMEFIPREVLWPADGLASKIAYDPPAGTEKRMELFADLAKMHWNKGFLVGGGTLFLLLPALIALSAAMSDPLPMRVVIGMVAAVGVVYAITNFLKGGFNDDLAKRLA